MQTELFSLSKIFTENLFRIPDYQRGYSWGLRQLGDFWEDIELLDGDRRHYTGVLTLETVRSVASDRWEDDQWIIKSKHYTPYYVVDGQQRLTTALILLQCILELTPASGVINFTPIEDIRKKFIYESRDKGVSRSYIFGYEKDNPSYEFLKRQIFLEPGESYTTNESTIYTRNLIAAKEYFGTKLARLGESQRGEIYTKLTQRFLFNIYVMGEHVDVFVAFETMNNRGKALSYLELLKNRLIFLSTRVDDDLDEQLKLRRLVNDSWKTVYHYLGRNDQNPLDDDRFLTTQSILYWAAQPHETTLAEFIEQRRRRRIGDEHPLTFLLSHVFTSRNLVRKGVVPPPDYKGITIDAPAIAAYAANLRTTVETYYYLVNPNEAPWGNDVRIQLTRLNRIGWNGGIVTAAALLSMFSEAEAATTLEELERFMFLQMLWYSPAPEMDMTELAIALIRKGLDSETLRAKLSKAITARLEKTDIGTAMLATREGLFYRWRGAKYFLFEYELHLKHKSKSDRDKLTWREFNSESYDSDFSTVEHIYPQQPTANYWKDRFDPYSSHQRNILKNSIGNLLALSHAKNAAMGNRPFSEKRDGDSKSSGYRFGSHSEIEVSGESEWTAQSILQRGIRMLNFMEQRWKLPFGDDRAKAEALKLGFLLSK